MAGFSAQQKLDGSSTGGFQTAQGETGETLDVILLEVLRLLEPLREKEPKPHLPNRDDNQKGGCNEHDSGLNCSNHEVNRICSSLEALVRGESLERLRIGVIGVTSSGKSTFINALLGEDLLPEKSGPATNVPVICRSGRSRTLLETRRTGETVEYREGDLTAALVSSLCSEEENGNNIKNIRHLQLELPDCGLQAELEIIDTPGTDVYGKEKHEEITLYECIPGFDIIVFMTQLARPFAQSDADLLQRVLDNDQRVLFIISHSDREKDDYEKGKLLKGKAEKLQNHVKELEAKLSTFPKLRNSGIVPVSSYLAKQAAGKKDSADWQQSNFGEVLNCFGQFLKASGAAPARDRAGRAHVTVNSLIAEILKVAPHLDQKTEKTDEEDTLKNEVDRLNDSRQRVARQIAKTVAAAERLMDKKRIISELMVGFQKLRDTDIWEAGVAIDHLPSQWDARVTEATGGIDRSRERCRNELEALGIPPGRNKVKRRMLDPEDLPSLSRRIKTQSESYSVEVPRAGWFAKFRDWAMGVRTETRTREIRTVDIRGLKQDLEEHFKARLDKLALFVAEQSQVQRDLFEEPIEIRWKEKKNLLDSLAGVRHAAEKQKEYLPELLERLIEMSRRLEALFRAHIPRVDDEFVSRCTDSDPDDSKRSVGTAEGGNKAVGAMIDLLAKFRRGAAVDRFWRVANYAGSNNKGIERLLVVGIIEEDARRLVEYLSRARVGSLEELQGPGGHLVEALIASHNRTIRLALLLRNLEIAAEELRKCCEEADVIAVQFDGGQPGAGLNRLLTDPNYEVFHQFAGKACLLFPDAALYDFRLGDLVLDVARMVSEHTAFSAAPWYVYDAARYDARYTDFMVTAQEAFRRNAPTREFVRDWRNQRLSVRPPFDEDSLQCAYNTIISSKIRGIK